MLEKDINESLNDLAKNKLSLDMEFKFSISSDINE